MNFCDFDELSLNCLKSNPQNMKKNIINFNNNFSRGHQLYLFVRALLVIGIFINVLRFICNELLLRASFNNPFFVR